MKTLAMVFVLGLTVSSLSFAQEHLAIEDCGASFETNSRSAKVSGSAAATEVKSEESKQD